jgi:hypothetical protein
VIPFWVTLVAKLPSSHLLKVAPMRPCRVGAIDSGCEVSWQPVPGVLAVGYRAEHLEAVPALLRIPAGVLEALPAEAVSLPFLWIWPDRQLHSYRWADLAQALTLEDPTP